MADTHIFYVLTTAITEIAFKRKFIKVSFVRDLVA